MPRSTNWRPAPSTWPAPLRKTGLPASPRRRLLAPAPSPDLDLATRRTEPPSAARAGRAAEDAARAVAGVTNSEGAAPAPARGLRAGHQPRLSPAPMRPPATALSATVVAGEGSGKQRDYAWRQARHRADLPSPAEIGQLAGDRAVARLNPGRLKSGQMPVVFDPRVGGRWSAISLAPCPARRSRGGPASCSTGWTSSCSTRPLSSTEDPLRPRGLRSRPFDGEGLPTAAAQAGRSRPNHRLADGKRLGPPAWPCSPPATPRAGGGAPGVTVGNLHLAAGSVAVPS
jgi:PmbA protein